MKKPIFFAICYLLFTFGYIFSVGFYHLGELVILIVVFLSLLAFYFNPNILDKVEILDNQIALRFILTLILVINVAIVGAKLGDSSQTNWVLFSPLNRVLALGSLIIALTYFLKSVPKFFLKYRLILLVVPALLIRIFAIISAPNPTIDVFYLLRDGPKLLLEGQNPYQLEYPAPYGVYNPTIIFVYGALTPFLFLPSDIIFNDPRFTLVAFDALSAFFIYKIAKTLKIAKILLELTLTIFLFHPLFPFMTEQSWIDPVIFTFLASAIYFLLLKRKSTMSVMLGLALAIKAVYFLPFVTFIAVQKPKFKNYLYLVAIPLLVSFPFIISDAKLFLERTLFDSGAIQSVPRLTNVSLSVSAVLLKFTKIVIPLPAVIIASIIFVLLLIAKGKRTLEFSTLASFLVFFFLFMIGPYVVLNYFAFLGNILLICFLLAIGAKKIKD